MFVLIRDESDGYLSQFLYFIDNTIHAPDWFPEACSSLKKVDFFASEALVKSFHNFLIWGTI